MLNILIAGKAGEGIKKSVSVIAEYFNDSGYYVFQYDDYQSTIKGGHNFSRLCVDSQPVYSQYNNADITFFSDYEAFLKHQSEFSESSTIIINAKNMLSNAIDFSSVMTKNGLNETFLGVVGISTILHCFGLSEALILTIVENAFHRDLDKNKLCVIKCLHLLSALDYKKRFFPKIGNKKAFYSGNSLIALGAILSGLDYYASYPMTPASSILHFLASHKEKFGLVVQHAESEIGAINMAIGACFSGARSATGSSGGGFALMAEAFSLAGMVEAPIYCIVSSRPGPATGMSTYTAQGDLNFVLHQGHGEFPRIIASPGSFEQAFFLSAQLLDLAWYFQTPCLLLTEKHLSESLMNINLNPQDYQKIETVLSTESDYKRYAFTENGISPLKFPPSDSMIKWNSNEHFENGVRTDEEKSALQMIEKRQRKQAYINAYISENLEMYKLYHNEGIPVLTYGSTCLSVLEALKYLNEEIKLIQIIYLEPFPSDLTNLITDQKFIVIEQSINEQFTTLIANKCSKKAFKTIKRYDGRPFDPKDLANQIKEIIHEIQING